MQQFPAKESGSCPSNYLVYVTPGLHIVIFHRNGYTTYGRSPGQLYFPVRDHYVTIPMGLLSLIARQGEKTAFKNFVCQNKLKKIP